MNNFLRFIFLVILSSVTTAQTTPEKINDLLSKYYEYGLLNASVLVAKNGEVIFKKGYGFANMEFDIPNAPNTVHRVGSITKQFTATVIMQLKEEGKLDVQEKITTYLKNYRKETGSKVKVFNLLTHTSGIPNYTSYPGFWSDSSRNHYKPDQLIEKFCSGDLEFEPGSKFSYSNSGYVLLAKIIEEVTGKTYEENMQERIFDKVGMKNTYLDRPEKIIKNRASGYDKLGVKYRNTAYFNVKNAFGAGDIVSTVEDLYKWDQALYSNLLLTDESKKEMFTPYLSNYGYGWSITKVDSITIYSHGGGINGFSAFITRIVDDKNLIVILNNIGTSPTLDISTNITKILYGDNYNYPKKPFASYLHEIILEEGIDAAINTANELLKEEKDLFDISERELNALGYTFLGEDKFDVAIAILQLNIDQFPKSFNVYDSMGEAFMVKGDKEKAREYYKKSVELNPQNQNGFDKLKELGVYIEKPKDAEVSEEILSSYVGNYELFPNFVLSITKEGNQLYSQATDQAKFPIFPETEKLFYLKVVPAKVEFIKDDAGPVNSIMLYQGGREMPGKRVEE